MNIKFNFSIPFLTSILLIFYFLELFSPTKYLRILSFVLIGSCYIYILLKKINDKNKKKLILQSEDLLKEQEMAKKVQQGLLSFENPEIKGYKLTKKCIPADIIGGDFYNFSFSDFGSYLENPKIPGVIEYKDRRNAFLNVTIGDVAGHGVSSALVMALSAGLFATLSKTTKSPAQILKKSNQTLLSYTQNSQITHVTALNAYINLDSNKLTYAKAGHPPALLIHKNGIVEYLEAKGVFLGMFEKEEYEEKEVNLISGDRLFLYTDGIIETADKDGELYGIDRLTEFVKQNQNETIEMIEKLIFNDLLKFSNSKSQTDDRTLIIIEIE